ncbi:MULTISPECIES: very short patch repair endonuclease [unclassified Rhizobium]|uniref:very short patch repair endonuclease n=1 Tax=unclassified Rhizobium TaxID=2613769 RepID=UPI001EF157AE|nr:MULTISPECIES: DNA mismatch endonuclease Vsr [unclassified Rhizobium]
MASVRQRDTKPELIVRRLLHARGWRYRLHKKELPGTPDIVFQSRRAALFINGCFWHGHCCKLGKIPKSRPEFWIPKIASNKERDSRKVQALVDSGWRAMTVWQCALKDCESALNEIEEFLRGVQSVAETPPNAVERGTEC